MPNTVIKIDSTAFFGCSGLTGLTLSNNLTYIGRQAFSGCSGLTNSSLSIPSSVTTIYDGSSFGGCNFASITVNSNNTIYNSNNNCNAIIETATNKLIVGCKNTVFPNNITEINNYAFYNCTGLTTLTIPASVTRIQSYAFSGTGLTTLTIPSTCTYVMTNAFTGCTNLRTVTLCHDNISSGGSSASASLSNTYGNYVTTYNINASVTSIGGSKFYNCTALTTVNLSNNITTIGNSAFYNCTSLSTIDLSHITTIGNSAFKGCTGLTSVNLLSTTTINNNGFEGCTGLTSVNISNITTLNAYAFKGCTGLTSVILPSVGSASIFETITGYQFQNCTNLTSIGPVGSGASIEIPSKLSYMKNAFQGCTGLISIVIPNNITSMDGSFINCTGLKNITIGTGIKSTSSTLFYNIFRGSSNIESITVDSNNTIWKSLNNAIIKKSNNELCFGCKTTIIDSTVTLIGTYSFY